MSDIEVEKNTKRKRKRYVIFHPTKATSAGLAREIATAPLSNPTPNCFENVSHSNRSRNAR